MAVAGLLVLHASAVQNPNNSILGSFEAPSTSIDMAKGTRVGTSDYGAFGIRDLYIVHRADGDPDAAVVVDHWEIEK